MYGYVRPVKGELKVSEYERYHGVYCGLCHTLARRYGFSCRFLVNYDFTFLAMLLAGPEQPDICRRRCAAHPVRGVECPMATASLETAADMTVILGWWKLADVAADAKAPVSWACRAACGVLKRHYKRAAARQPAFAEAVEKNLRALRRLEGEDGASLDEAADKFALILRSIGEGQRTEPLRRITGELLYHLGRIIYILDAVDDLPEDVARGGYNPLLRRFDLAEGKLAPADAKTLRAGLQLSHNALAGAFALMDEGIYSGIVSNIIYLGLPAVTQAVFSGQWKASAKKHRERSSI